MRHPHTARPARTYVKVAPSRVTKTFFVHEIHGHAETADTSAGSYLNFYLDGHFGDALTQNDAARAAITIALYREHNSLADPRDYELRDDRIRMLETQLADTAATTSIAPWANPSTRRPPRAPHTWRSLAANLSPAQERLVRELANGTPIALAKNARSLDILETQGIVEYTTDERFLRSVR